VCTSEGDEIVQSAASVSVVGLGKPARDTAVAQAKGSASDIDPELHDYLREWRRVTAKEQGVPAFVVMHDTSLEALCRARPVSLSALLAVSGFGERKVEMYGEQILDAIGRFGKANELRHASCGDSPNPQRKRGGCSPKAARSKKSQPSEAARFLPSSAQSPIRAQASQPQASISRPLGI
jgi:ribonuclease D